jgi:O-antigen/teichoic acid export membrane protein
LTAANVAALSSSVAQQILFGRRKNKLFAVFVVIETVATILLAVILVPHWGILGVAAATLIPMAVIEGLVIPALTSSQVGTSILQYWREGILPNLVIAALVLAVSKALMPHVPGWGWARVFLSFTVVSVIHLTTCFFFLVESEHKRRFASLILDRFAWVKS